MPDTLQLPCEPTFKPEPELLNMRGLTHCSCLAMIWLHLESLGPSTLKGQSPEQTSSTNVQPSAQISHAWGSISLFRHPQWPRTNSGAECAADVVHCRGRSLNRPARHHFLLVTHTYTARRTGSRCSCDLAHHAAAGNVLC